MSSVELTSLSRLDQEEGRENPPPFPHYPDNASNHVTEIPTDHVHALTYNRDGSLRHRSHSPMNLDNPDFPTTNTAHAPAAVDAAAVEAAETAAWAEDQGKDLSGCSRSVNQVQQSVIVFLAAHRKTLKGVVLVVLALLYLAYFAYSLSRRFGDEGSVRLLVGTLLAVTLLLVHFTWGGVTRRLSEVSLRISTRDRRHALRRGVRWLLYVVSVVAMVTLLIVLVAMETPGNLTSLAGLAAFIFLSWVTSVDPARVNWHPVFWGFSLQFYFACFILRTRVGYEAFSWLGDRVTNFLSYAEEGAAFVFGDNFRVHFFAFSVMSMVVFFSSVTSVLYYLGVMQKVVSVLGRFLGFCLGTTAAESLSAAFNIFMGMTDTPLMLRPYLSAMTRSELHAIMTGGFATIAGSVLGAYIGMGVPANHLLSASVMSAPAALAISKLTYPETVPRRVNAEDYDILAKGTEINLIEAASAGASNSLVIVGSIMVNVIAFLSLLKFVNATLTWFGERAGVENLTFELICSYLLYPVALFMGTEPGLDCRRVGELVGIKTFTNEFIAYRALQKLLLNRQKWANYTQAYDVNDPANVAYDDLDVNLTQWGVVLEKGVLSPRSEMIATYALCGFSNFGSMGILLGAMSAMAPSRRADLAAIVLRAMIAGNIACFFTACIAGLFFREYD